MKYKFNKTKNRNYKLCKNLNTSYCIVWSACDECYYYEIKDTCPNCNREIPNKEHLRKNGCKWCVPEKNTPYCNGCY